jgi:glyoxylase I family protein
MLFKAVHHIAIICSDYAKSKHFYTEILGFSVIHEAYREARLSYKLDLAVGENVQIELFSFPNPPPRVSGIRGEACGLRHLAFSVDNIYTTVAYLVEHGIVVEPIRIDEFTGKKFTFFADPDGLPLEIYST